MYNKFNDIHRYHKLWVQPRSLITPVLSQLYTLTFHILYSIKPPVIKVQSLKCGGMMLKNMKQMKS